MFLLRWKFPLDKGETLSELESKFVKVKTISND